MAMVRRPPQAMTVAWQFGVQLWLMRDAMVPCNGPRRKRMGSEEGKGEIAHPDPILGGELPIGAPRGAQLVPAELAQTPARVGTGRAR